jgi:hypothetical protein
MTFFIPVRVVFPLFFAIAPRWDDHFRLCSQNDLDEIDVIISPVGDQALKLQISHQRFGLGNVMPLTTGQAKTQRVAQRIDTHMDFSAEPAPAAAERLLGLTTLF